MRRYGEQLLTVAARRLAPRFAAPEGWQRPPPRSVLVIKPCCAGDLVFTTAALRELRRALPTSRIDIAVGAWSRPVVETSPHLDGLLDLGDLTDLRPSRPHLLQVAQELRGRAYDWCLVLDRSPSLGLLAALARIPLRAGLDSFGRGFPLNVRVPANAVRHEADLYLDVVHALGIEPQDGATEFTPSAADADWAVTVLKRLEAKGQLRRPLSILHPGGGRNPGMRFAAKQWSADRFGALARLALDRLHGSVVIVGGPADREVAGRVLAGAGEDDHLIDLTGLTSLGQLAALAAHADAFVGNDTGPSHLAEAVGTPTVMIFGPSDPRRYGPRRPNGSVVWAPEDVARHLRLDSARPHRLGALDRPPSATVETVWAALNRALLAGRPTVEPGVPIWPYASAAPAGRGAGEGGTERLGEQPRESSGPPGPGRRSPGESPGLKPRAEWTKPPEGG